MELMVIFLMVKIFHNIDYFNSWICLGIFFMNTEHLQLGINAKKNYLISYLKI